MAVTFDWHDEDQTLLYITFTGDWGMREFSRAIETIYVMLDEVDHPVDLIINMIDSTASMPRLFAQISVREMEHLNTRVHANQRQVVIAGGSLFLRTIFNVMRKSAPRLINHVVYADKLEEARSIIHRNNALSSGV